jgi:ABC-type Fe3+/spermidine/putrescine transport system ATPase subunit
LQGKLDRRSGEDCAIVMPDGARVQGPFASQLQAGHGAVEIMIRPDHFRLANGAEDGRPKLTGTVTDATYLGECTLVAIRTAWGAALTARLSPTLSEPAGLALGQTITLTCEPADIRVF